jgi:pimeloyl-ACP methyl ester carboxylesterase
LYQTRKVDLKAPSSTPSQDEGEREHPEKEKRSKMNVRKEVMPGVCIEPRIASTEKGAVEFDITGTRGPVILSIHGGLGGADQARLIANWLNTSTYRILSPSRPGYLGTPLESGKTFEQQADLLAALLDHLKIEKVAVLGYSAGGPPAYLFAIRHPERVWALVAVDSISGYYHMPETDGLTTAIFMSAIGQKIVNMINEKKPEILLKEALQAMGSYTKEQKKRQIDHVMNSPQALAFWEAFLGTFNPYPERKKGNENDMEESLKLTHLPLEQVHCPSLIIHGTYDADCKFYDGVYAYEHIPGAERYWIEEGDHLGFWLSQYAEQAQEVARVFLVKHAPVFV